MYRYFSTKNFSVRLLGSCFSIWFDILKWCLVFSEKSKQNREVTLILQDKAGLFASCYAQWMGLLNKADVNGFRDICRENTSILRKLDINAFRPTLSRGITVFDFQNSGTKSIFVRLASEHWGVVTTK